MTKKLLFYQRYGVEEYYIYEPDKNELTGLERSGEWLEPIEEMDGWDLSSTANSLSTNNRYPRNLPTGWRFVPDFRGIRPTPRARTPTGLEDALTQLGRESTALSTFDRTVARKGN